MPCNDYGFESNSIVFFNGRLSWLMFNKVDKTRIIIQTLDLGSERYCQFPTPVHGDDNSAQTLEVLGDSLCVCVDHFKTRHDVWSMKEYGVTKTWTLLYSIDLEDMPWVSEYCTPWIFSKTGKMVLLIEEQP